MVILGILDADYGPTDAGRINHGLMFFWRYRGVHGHPAIIPFDVQFVGTGIVTNGFAVA